MTQIFLDCDGVLADFDKLAEQIFGMNPRLFEDTYGSKEFWKQLRNHENFFGSLDLMPDAMVLFEAVKHHNPIILTGAPMGNWSAPQKMGWGSLNFPTTKMIVVSPSRDKFKHMVNPGDILVDDLLKYRHIWEENGGIFVHHTSAASSIKMLQELGILEDDGAL